MNGESSYAVPTLMGLWFVVLMTAAAKRSILAITALLFAGLIPAAYLAIFAEAENQAIGEKITGIFSNVGYVWWISIPIAATVYWLSQNRLDQSNKVEK